jgi:hypothetical protein
LDAVQKGQIVKFLQIRFILYSSFRKVSIWVTLTQCEHLHPLIHAGQASPVWRQSPVCCLPQKKAKISSSLFCRLLHRVWCTSCRARASFMRYACMYPARLFLLETPIDICSAEDRASEDEAVT